MQNEKPGSQTSEFKLAAGGIVGTFVAAVAAAVAGHPKIALVLVAAGGVLSACYAFLRTWLKKERAGTMDWLSTQQEETLEKALRAVGTLSDVLKLIVAEDDPPADTTETEGDA